MFATTASKRRDDSVPPVVSAYVIPHLSVDSTQHFAHSPRLIAELGKSHRLLAIIERGEEPGALEGASDVIMVKPSSGLPRMIHTLSAIRRAHRLGVSRYFLRYSRTFALALILSRPIYRHRIIYWRSGMAEIRESGRSVTTRERLRVWIDNAINRFILHRADIVATGPETMMSWTQERWAIPKHRMRLLYNDIDTDRFKPLSPDRRAEVRSELGWPADSFIVLFVHHLSFRRGTRLLGPIVEALEQEHGPDVLLVVVGSGPDAGLVDRLERSTSGRSVAVRALGPKPNSDLMKYFAAADVFLMPSYEEGFPRVVLEAMASGTLVVTTDAGGTRDLVGQQYDLIRPVGDHAGLAGCLQRVRLMSDHERAERSHAARSRAVASFSTSVVSRMYKDLFS